MSINDHKLTVSLDERSYEIIIGSKLLERAGELIAPFAASKRAVIITDMNVGELYAQTVSQSLTKAHITNGIISVPAGEKSKSVPLYSELMETLLKLKPDRKTVLVALGGGVIGDLVGFAASTLLRGVPFMQIPTSLLAQVDSSVGGKTAINAEAGKNLIGSFYQPKLVLADLDTLKTLPPREMRSGYAEIIKYGLIADKEFYAWCLSHGEKLLAGDPVTLQQAVMKSCSMKAAIVEKDEREADTRALLNFGHTFAHALEAETGFGDTLLHGEAVAIGMVMACRLGARMGLADKKAEQELAQHFKTLGMMAEPNDVKHKWNAKKIAAHFAGDKKAEAGQLTFVVLNKVGEAKVAKGVDSQLAHDVVASYLAA